MMDVMLRSCVIRFALPLLLLFAACDDRSKEKDKPAAAEPVPLKNDQVATLSPKTPDSAAPSASAAPPASPVLDLVVGTGAEAKDGSKVKVHYVGTLTNGKQFDSSYEKKKPYSFVVGGGAVIKGWDSGVVGMKVGGKRRLTIPPALGYGDKGRLPLIPPNATLVFEIELLEVK